MQLPNNLQGKTEHFVMPLKCLFLAVPALGTGTRCSTYRAHPVPWLSCSSEDNFSYSANRFAKAKVGHRLFPPCFSFLRSASVTAYTKEPQTPVSSAFSIHPQLLPSPLIIVKLMS